MLTPAVVFVEVSTLRKLTTRIASFLNLFCTEISLGSRPAAINTDRIVFLLFLSLSLFRCLCLCL
jgi:hypothetical protein